MSSHAAVEEFCLVLSEVDLAKTEQVTSALREVFGLSEAMATQIAYAAPLVLLTGLTKPQTVSMGPHLRKLGESGARLEFTAEPDESIPPLTWPTPPEVAGRRVEEYRERQAPVVQTFRCPDCGAVLKVVLASEEASAPAETAAPTPPPPPSPRAARAAEPATEAPAPEPESIPEIAPEPEPESIPEIAPDPEPTPPDEEAPYGSRLARKPPGKQASPPAAPAEPSLADLERAEEVEDPLEEPDIIDDLPEIDEIPPPAPAEPAPEPEPGQESDETGDDEESSGDGDGDEGGDWNVFLSKAKNPKVVDLLMEIKGLGREEAAKLAAKSIIPVAKGVSKERADEIRRAFDEHKIRVRLSQKRH